MATNQVIDLVKTTPTKGADCIVIQFTNFFLHGYPPALNVRTP